MLCKYRDALGKPGKGVHFHIAGIAVIDVLLTILLALFIAHFTKWNIWWTLLSLFVIAIVIHRLFCVNTTVNKVIFGEV